jgi:hypothetical protein
MSALAAIRYSPERADEWNAFVRSSRNGTFLFEPSCPRIEAGKT